MHIMPHRFESFFNSDEISSLTAVYDVLYPGLEIRHIPMLHGHFLELKVFNETFISVTSKGSHFSAISSYWAGIRGTSHSQMITFVWMLRRTFLDIR